ncbi:hypothetical protein RRG08_065262 [Elysia crispata]|uniref:Uncharacterized protein n=1 Tax=Elysia crispata TaxID=231223 RepID=A0AAE0Z3G8_9GAST|nr:hypothetical protein RRG08_065262 [Elysia crispata]
MGQVYSGLLKVAVSPEFTESKTYGWKKLEFLTKLSSTERSVSVREQRPRLTASLLNFLFLACLGADEKPRRHQTPTLWWKRKAGSSPALSASVARWWTQYR